MFEPETQYDIALAQRWDDFIDWPARAEAEGDFFADRLREAGACSVLDAASGSGFHTVALARAGFSVVASDASSAMVRQTRKACRAHGVDVQVCRADWRQLAATFTQQFDSVVVLGNSFTHLLAAQDRDRALDQFRKVLRPGGLFMLDSRNYDKILDTAAPFTGRYYYCGRSVTCTLLLVSVERVRFRYEFSDGLVRELDASPNRQAALSQLLERAGFIDQRSYGDFRAQYEPLDPDYVIYCARRSLHAHGKENNR